MASTLSNFSLELKEMYPRFDLTVNSRLYLSLKRNSLI